MRKSNLTYEQLIELAPKDRPFQVEVGLEYKQISWAYINTDFMCMLLDISVPDYYWQNNYTGTFTLIDEYRNMYEKPEVLEVGTKVEILESVKDVGYYRTSQNIEEITDQIGTLNIIDEVRDDDYGIYYETKKGYRFPHYCVRPVERVEEKKEIITVNGKKYKLIKE